ncbi:MAG: SUMF1/EgtB/PvdO family nonheme iron enzyme [Candidatus Latescibacteria bacterium]|nr:SUMF1/EgtB/PvdO family nonheme iron enzyme [Candidatus Latescibacterota bacterium]
MRFCKIFAVFLLVLSSRSSLYAQTGFVTIPSVSYGVVDGISGIPVTVSVAAFFIAKTEVTQQEYSEIMNNNPSFHKGADFPVENVSWWEAVYFCNRKSTNDGLQPCYNLRTGECDLKKNGYRLPTDAEWGIALAGNTFTDSDDIHAYANIGESNTKNIPMLLQSLAEKKTGIVGQLRPNENGLYDMIGNVWEWCTDYRNPVGDTPMPPQNPQGPSHGVERVIRGGSFISMVNNWSRGYRSSMKPDYKSRFIGFRLCRSTGVKPAKNSIDISEWIRPYKNTPDSLVDNTGNLSSLTIDSHGRKIESPDQWNTHREFLKNKWSELLGNMNNDPPEPCAELIQTITGDCYTGKLMYLQVEPDFSEKIYVMMPDRPVRVPAPVIIVPYYDVDTPAGENLGGRNFEPPGVRSFAYLMVRHGYIAVAVRWFGESYGAQYGEAVANLKLKHPDITGLGKWVWDARRVVDFIYTMDEADHNNIGIIGHSLGGKMALYAAAMDERITAAVSSELGIGLEFSNYDDFWYYGDFIRDIDATTDHHELLALIAPRPFLLIGGDEYDTDKSWYYINAAESIYSLYDKPNNIGYFNHGEGHTPTPEAVRLSAEWLMYYLNR